ncbi:hypothetical protein [Pelomonas sp. SE-A7]|uniref:hypothetical protein n=1 Tax=Pelomonas sp. SE-A7 TaxID=3054953 RepID=UPI00259CD77E|nr:hypothetical protein [Pelomonas sp. SE-A7]MDM4767540.1 hypothetical protein [Pelomonas sp. SE-A7]
MNALNKSRLKYASGFVVAALIGALLAPGVELDASLVQARRNSWELPDLPRKPELTAIGLSLVTSPMFEPEAQVRAAAAAAAAAESEDKRWRIAGLFRRDKQRGVLINFMAPGKPPQTLHVGDRLPSGHMIKRIDDGEVCVQLGNKTYRLGVEYRD